MKKITMMIGAMIFMLACNNTSDSGTLSSDSLQNENIRNSDVNNRNATQYDSVSTRRDTASYERMTNKTRGNTPE